MCHGVTHLVGERQGQLRVCLCEFRETGFNVVAGLADNLEIADYGILSHFVLQERHFAQVLGIALNALDGLEDMPR